MGAMQRLKGANYEREVVKILKELGWSGAARNLDQTRDGGGDIVFPRYLFECKRYAQISVYRWLEQAEDAAEALGGDKMPIVVARADNKTSIAILNFIDFITILNAAEQWWEMYGKPNTERDSDG